MWSMGQISCFFLRTLKQSPTDRFYHVCYMGCIHSSNQKRRFFNFLSHIFIQHIPSQSIIATVKDHAFNKSVGTIIPQHCHHSTLLPALGKCRGTDHLPKGQRCSSSQNELWHSWTITRHPWPSKALLIFQLPSPSATRCNSGEIPAQSIPRKRRPVVTFSKCSLQGQTFIPSMHVWVFTTGRE